MSRLAVLTPGYSISLWILASPVGTRKIAPIVYNVRLSPNKHGEVSAEWDEWIEKRSNAVAADVGSSQPDEFFS